MTIKTTAIIVYESGSDLNEGDLFIAKVDYVGNRRRVTLTKVDEDDV